MAIQEHDVKTFKDDDKLGEPQPAAANSEGTAPVVVTRPYKISAPAWWHGTRTPLGVLLLSIIVMVALLSFSLGSVFTSSPNKSADTTSNNSTGNSSSSSMGDTATTPTSNVPNATQSYGNQLAKYVVDPDGAKHFTLTAEQVMWEPVKGQRVLAWTIDGTVPGPMIRVTGGDHVRITLINHLPQSTSMHWHGLQLPSSVDGVPGVGQKPIEPGQQYTYDFTVNPEDAGTHWYHSHDNDVTQVMGGFYGAFIVDPRPGSPEALREPKADVEYTEFISELGGYFVINGKSYPDTQPINVKHGQMVRIRLIGASEMIHPMHLHGHFFNIVAEDGRTMAQPIQKDTVQVAPGETYDLIFNAWAAPGSIYPFHCHILTHLMNPGQSADQMGGLIVLVEYAK